MRMRILLGRPSVGGPSCVAKAVQPRQRLGLNRGFEVDELARAAADLDTTVLHHRNAGRVVAAILQSPKAIEDDGDDGFRADVSDDSAHTASAFSLSFLLAFLAPAFFVLLPSPPNAERPGGY